MSKVALFALLVVISISYIGTASGSSVLWDTLGKFSSRGDSHVVAQGGNLRLKLFPENNTDADSFCHYDLYPKSMQCEYAKADPDCAGGRINYLSFYACSDESIQDLIMAFYFLVLFLIFYLLGTTADKYFCPQVEELTDRLHLTPRVAGVTLLSLGNGAPDVFAGINAVRQNQLDLALGQLLGGGMFVTTIVAGGVIFVADGIRTRFPLLRDLEMYLMLVAALMVMTSENALTFYTSGMLLAYYVIFVGLAYYSDKKLVRKVQSEAPHQLSSVPMLERAGTQAELLNQEYRIMRRARINIGTVLDHLSLTSEGKVKRTLLGYCAKCVREFVHWVEAPFNVLRNCSVVNCVAECWNPEEDSRIQASVALVGAPLLIGFWQDVLEDKIGTCPVWVFLLCLGVPLGLLFICTCPTDHPPSYSLVLIFLGFVTAAFWVDIFASELVDLLTTIGHVLSISQITMGATILAWGGAIGDFTADILLARNKREGMAITACFATPMFSLLMVIGWGVMLRSFVKPISISLSTQMYIPFSFVIGSLVISLTVAFGFGRMSKSLGNRLPKNHAYLLWALYGAFLITMTAYEIFGNPKS
eukprot:c10082_g1_i1.p1 GENE.c10082_g1_i1~~c10082_g1_i1.p1  ORF type:complete len:588 (+),score=147.53 c10082_g1_i1:74-1837(+)